MSEMGHPPEQPTPDQNLDAKPTGRRGYMVAICDLITDAKSDLDPETFVTFLQVAVDRLGIEWAELAAKQLAGENDR